MYFHYNNREHLPFAQGRMTLSSHQSIPVVQILQYCHNVQALPCIYYYFLLIYFFLPSLCNIFVVVCCKVWILGVWGELACHERLFNPPPQFSRLGTWCPMYKCFVVSCMYLDGGIGGRRVATYFFAFFSIIYILGLVCYKHIIHAKLGSLAYFFLQSPGHRHHHSLCAIWLPSPFGFICTSMLRNSIDEE